jgi:hypothetical protein
MEANTSSLFCEINSPFVAWLLRSVCRSNTRNLNISHRFYLQIISNSESINARILPFAAALANRGHRVQILDMDHLAQVSSHLVFIVFCSLVLVSMTTCTRLHGCHHAKVQLPTFPTQLPRLCTRHFLPSFCTDIAGEQFHFACGGICGEAGEGFRFFPESEHSAHLGSR